MHLICSLFRCLTLFESLLLGFLFLLCFFLFWFPFPFVFPILTFSLTFPDIGFSAVVLGFPVLFFLQPNLFPLLSGLEPPFTLIFPHFLFLFLIFFPGLCLFKYDLLLDFLLFLINAPVPILVKCLCFTVLPLFSSNFSSCFTKEGLDYLGKTRFWLDIFSG